MLPGRLSSFFSEETSVSEDDRNQPDYKKTLQNQRSQKKRIKERETLFRISSLLQV